MSVTEEPMNEIKKFQFDVSFDEEQPTDNDINDLEEETIESKEQEIAAPSFSEQQLEAAKLAAFEKGKEEGIQNAADATEKLLSETLDALYNRFQSLFNQQSLANTQILDDATRTAVAIIRKCIPHLASSEALKIIENMIREVLTDLQEEPNVIIFLHSDLITPMNHRITKITKESNFVGQIQLEEDKSVALGDCRMTWNNGSAERKMDALLKAANDIVAQNLSTIIQNIKASNIASSSAHEISDDTQAIKDGDSTSHLPDTGGTTDINESSNSNITQDSITNSQQSEKNEQTSGWSESSTPITADRNIADPNTRGEAESISIPDQEAISEPTENVESLTNQIDNEEANGIEERQTTPTPKS